MTAVRYRSCPARARLPNCAIDPARHALRNTEPRGKAKLFTLFKGCIAIAAGTTEPLQYCGLVFLKLGSCVAAARISRAGRRLQPITMLFLLAASLLRHLSTILPPPWPCKDKVLSGLEPNALAFPQGLARCAAAARRSRSRRPRGAHLRPVLRLP
jgi:hypothetical protein